MNILLADPNGNFIHQILESWTLDAADLFGVQNERELIASLEQNHFQAVFLNVHFCTLENLDVLSLIQQKQPQAEIISICTPEKISLAEETLNRGAQSYLVQPISTRTISTTVSRIITRTAERQNYRALEDHVLEDLLGNTAEIKKILRMVHKVAPSSSTILINGESGSGKEFFANIIHRLSNRNQKPFIAVNCGAIPENIVESELFGIRKGAFTGAIQSKPGLFEEADTGTLFLDELGELPLQTQVKLLRFLENREIRRVGDTENRHIDVRIIAATNKNIAEEVRNGNFREDLYFRLNTFQFEVPPLRRRKQTIPNLSRYFISKFNKELDRNIDNIDPSAQMALASYHYPGNVRELSNIIEHAVVMADTTTIRLSDLPEKLWKPTQSFQALPASTHDQPLSITAQNKEDLRIETLAEIEKKQILFALERLNHNQTEVAKTLGISRSTLWRKLQEHKIK